jgi:ADP-heptose:LPS heptosyltransferase
VPVPGVLLAAVGDAPSQRPELDARPLLVVLRALGLGDLLTAVPALRGLRDAHPEHRIALAAPVVLAPLAHLTEAVDEVVDTATLAALDLALAGADLGVNLHGRGPQSHRVLLASRPRRTVAFEHADVPQSRGSPAWLPDEHEVARWCRLLEESGVPTDPERLDLPPPPGARSEAAAAHGATLIHPGAASPARRWPPGRFAAVARAERDAARAVVLTGSAGEQGLARSIGDAAGLEPEAVLAGRTDLLGLAEVVAGAGRVVCGDTGVAHLATAFGTPSVVLFGPTSPDEWGPPPDRRARHRPLWAGRRGDPHASEPDPGLLELTVDDVLDALRDLADEAVERVPAAAARLNA